MVVKGGGGVLLVGFRVVFALAAVLFLCVPCCFLVSVPSVQPFVFLRSRLLVLSCRRSPVSVHNSRI